MVVRPSVSDEPLQVVWEGVMHGAPVRDVDRASLVRFTRADQGQDLLEYGLLMALISVVAIGAVTLLGRQIDEVLWQLIASAF